MIINEDILFNEPQVGQTGRTFWRLDGPGKRHNYTKGEWGFEVQRIYRDAVAGRKLKEWELLCCKWYWDTYPSGEYAPLGKEIIGVLLPIKKLTKSEFEEEVKKTEKRFWESDDGKRLAESGGHRDNEDNSVHCAVPECKKVIPMARLIRGAIYCSKKCQKDAANRRQKKA